MGYRPLRPTVCWELKLVSLVLIILTRRYSGEIIMIKGGGNGEQVKEQ